MAGLERSANPRVLQRQPVETLRVPIENRRLVVLGDIPALHQLGDIALAALVGDFVGEVGREE
jgi:hypothetical protein